MLKIDPTLFLHNLNLTQEYCRSQMDKGENDNAKIFRSFNPINNGRLIFSFELQKFDLDIHPNVNHCTLTKWSIDPQGQGNERVVDNLFEEQMSFKHTLTFSGKDRTYEGDILVSEIDYTVIDGASEVQSLGLIDIFDIPPVDTWFYLTKEKDTRLLFAWIPKKYEEYINEAISVNMLDIINWFKYRLPNHYQNIIPG